MNICANRLQSTILACIWLAACDNSSVTLQTARNATYYGIYDDPVTLQDGTFEGEPYVAGGASRPRAGMADGSFTTGDLDADGNADGVVILWESAAGSGSYHYLAVLRPTPSGVVNVDTDLIGDRPRLQSLAVVDGVIELDLIEQGPGDAACCPTAQRTRRWELRDSSLQELDAIERVE